MRSARPRRRDGLLDQDRKADHIRLALEERMQAGGSYFDDYTFSHVALPEIDRADLDTSVTFLGRTLRAPLLISCMTGGTEAAGRINRHLAIAAEATQIAIGVGSQRKALEDPSQTESFLVREFATSVPLLGNLGAVQLNYGFGVDECEQAVRMIGADALVFHLNALQEAIQPEGQCNLTALLPKMADVARQLSVPVVVKEVGCGISGAVAESLAKNGLRIIDTAGLGGTSWARIEAQRAGDIPVGELFSNWGIPTPTSIEEVRRVPGVFLIGSGGVRSGVDAAKAIALGADLVGMAYPFLKVAVESPEAVIQKIEKTIEELKIAMFCVGAASLQALGQVKLNRKSRH